MSSCHQNILLTHPTGMTNLNCTCIDANKIYKWPTIPGWPTLMAHGLMPIKYSVDPPYTRTTYVPCRRPCWWYRWSQTRRSRRTWSWQTRWWSCRSGRGTASSPRWHPSAQTWSLPWSAMIIHFQETQGVDSCTTTSTTNLQEKKIPLGSWLCFV